MPIKMIIFLLLLHLLYSFILYVCLLRKDIRKRKVKRKFRRNLFLGIMWWDNYNFILLTLFLLLGGINIMYLDDSNNYDFYTFVIPYILLLSVIIFSVVRVPIQIVRELRIKNDQEIESDNIIRQYTPPVLAVLYTIIFLYYRLFDHHSNGGNLVLIVSGLLLISLSLYIGYFSTYRIYNDILFIQHGFHNT